MVPELRVFVGEPLAVRPRAQLGARPLTRHGSQLWGHWALAAGFGRRGSQEGPAACG
jgi:hypothetical protein